MCFVCAVVLEARLIASNGGRRRSACTCWPFPTTARHDDGGYGSTASKRDDLGRIRIRWVQWRSAVAFWWNRALIDLTNYFATYMSLRQTQRKWKTNDRCEEEAGTRQREARRPWRTCSERRRPKCFSPRVRLGLLAGHGGRAWHGRAVVAWGGMVAVLCHGDGEQWLSVLVLPRQEEEGEERNGRGSEWRRWVRVKVGRSAPTRATGQGGRWGRTSERRLYAARGVCGGRARSAPKTVRGWLAGPAGQPGFWNIFF